MQNVTSLYRKIVVRKEKVAKGNKGGRWSGFDSAKPQQARTRAETKRGPTRPSQQQDDARTSESERSRPLRARTQASQASEPASMLSHERGIETICVSASAEVESASGSGA